jgi:regulatory protein
MDEKLYTQALKFLARRPRSEKEVKDNLKKKKASEDQIIPIIDLLKKQKFLNDLDFAKWWLEQRSNFKPKGWYVLQFELKQKGIEQEVIKKLEQEFKNAQIVEKTELEMAKELVERRKKKYAGLPAREMYQKLGSFLARRGFDLDTIKAVIDPLLEK